jgi:hypothetical protein
MCIFSMTFLSVNDNLFQLMSEVPFFLFGYIKKEPGMSFLNQFYAILIRDAHNNLCQNFTCNLIK